MAYPPAPWHLQGFSLQTLHLLDVERVRPQVPAELKIVSILPGKTLGGVYVASYGKGSTLEYNELIVVNALVYQAGQIGAWVSHIYVDHPDSIAGGREIWGLPKQMAQFDWELEDVPSVKVKQDDRLLCVLRTRWQIPGWQQPIAIPAFGLLHSHLLKIKGEGKLKLNLAGVDLTIPPESSFAELDMGHPWIGFYCNPIHLVANVPLVVRELEPLYR